MRWACVAVSLHDAQNVVEGTPVATGVVSRAVLVAR